MKQEFHYGSWYVEYSSKDGASLNRLCYDGFDLLTTKPETFHSPSTDYGRYETRPVYGYDDCFPTVDSCVFPDLDWTVPDHGELCWLSWKTSAKSDRLSFSVSSKTLPLLFKREMHFTETGITWAFEVLNESDKILPFQHVMHPLMPLHEIVHVDLPPFKSVINEISNQTMDLKNPEAVQDFLLNQASGTANMLLLQRVEIGKMSWTFRNGFRLEVTFPEKYFPTIGIWWNNSGYPDEEGCRRNECAFEPIPGPTSVLTEAYKDGSCLSVPPGKRFTWKIQWKINH